MSDSAAASSGPERGSVPPAAAVAAATPVPVGSGIAGGSGARLEAIDVLRGFVMVLMALDHTRDFFHGGAIRGLDPMAAATTTPALYATRWITHLCAPAFLLLAGIGARLSLDRGRTPGELARFLLTRGLWLIVLEMTWVQWVGWNWAFDFRLHHGFVLWAIGWSMIALAALVHVPPAVAAGVGLALMAGHNLLDGLKPADFGAWAGVWRVLHEGGRVPLGGGHVLAAGYPLIPWIGVMAAGYGLGGWYRLESAVRRRRLAVLGAAAVAGFFGLRLSGAYGDPRPWNAAAEGVASVYSLLDCRKYPPSLGYLLMTLGPALLLLAWWERGTGAWGRALQAIGRVPLFFYLLHLPLLHGLALLTGLARGQEVGWLYGLERPKPPPEAGFGLPGTYVAWGVAVALLYPVCVRFDAYKRRRRSAWLGYL